MKNTHNKIILGLATVFAIFGMASVSFAASPTMLSMPATGVTQTQATLNGTFNANGTSPMDVRFEYGTTTKLGKFTTYNTQVSAYGSYSDTITGLAPNTTYYFRAMGVNATSPDYGTILDFTTSGYGMPSAITLPATNISQTQATLNGTFNSNGLSVDTWFEYGISSSLSGSSSTNIISQSSTNGNMSETLSGLSPNTTYYFRAVSRSAGGTKRSNAILSFVTSNGGYTPTNNCVINNFAPNTYNVSSGGTVYISWNTTNCTNATLSPSGYQSTNRTNYAVYPNGTTRYTLNAYNGSTSDSRQFTVTVGNYNPNYNCRIDYFRSNTYNVTSGSPAYLSWDSSNCSYLTLSPSGYDSDSESRYRVYPSYPSTTYRLRGPNGATDSITIYVDRNNNGGGNGCLGCSNGNDRPIVTTHSVSNVTSTSAVLHGYANGNGKTIDIWFEYGTTPNLSSSTSSNYGGYITNANGALGGLIPSTTYYYRLAARNSYGTTYGDIMSFATNRVVNNNNNTVINNTKNTNTTNTNNNNDNNQTNNQNNNNNNNETNVNNDQGNGLSASAGSTGFSIFPQTFLGWLVWVLIILAAIIIIRSMMKNEYHDRGI